MAFVKPLNLLHLPLLAATAVNQAGLVLHLENVGGVAQVDICAAGEQPVGVAYMTTEDPLFDPNDLGHAVQFMTGVEIAFVREGVVRIPCHQLVVQGNILPGHLLSMTGANTIGHVRRHVPTAIAGAYAAANMLTVLEEPGTIVAVALETFTASATAGLIRCLLRIAEQDFAV